MLGWKEASGRRARLLLASTSGDGVSGTVIWLAAIMSLHACALSCIARTTARTLFYALQISRPPVSQLSKTLWLGQPAFVGEPVPAVAKEQPALRLSGRS